MSEIIAMSSLDDLADVLSRQSYDDRMEFAKYLADAASDWVQQGNEIDADYIALLLTGFVEFNEDDAS